ncbi:MAG: YdeI/OmpD-associated family protein [Oscillospiraceae bacterium]|jgi:uncharacterized protein YdeI (YjbR/CyaY-like superfamily)|nr:YdeI/OmpD-associated family protein [Oscillospiraceae bacterium]
MVHYDPMSQLPEGFTMALAQNPAALDAFGRLPGQEKTHYVDRAHQTSSREEMRSLVSELGKGYTL